MKTLIIHHVEPMWEQSFLLHPQLYVDAILRHLQDVTYGKIIMTTLEGDAYPELEWECNVHHEWSYCWEDPEADPGWYKTCDIDPEDIIRVTGREFAYIYPWIKELKNEEVYVLGGSSSACLADLVDTLNYIEIDHTVLWDLTY